jgi:hypothetical protein
MRGLFPLGFFAATAPHPFQPFVALDSQVNTLREGCASPEAGERGEVQDDAK